MVDIVVSVAAKVAEYLVAPIGRQCGYVIFSDSHVRQLNGELKKLDQEKQSVQHIVNQHRNNMKGIEAKIEQWMTEAETVANKADELLKNDGTAQETCFHGRLPNPKARYRLGKRMSKTAKEIEALIETCRQFQTYAFENPPQAHVGGASDVNASAVDGGDTITGSRASIFQDIMKALDDENLKVIGVYGLGGVGKTTLLKEVEKKLRKDVRPFRMIVNAEVSQALDLNNIQGQIADALGLNLKDKKTQQGRRHALSERLKLDPNETFLILFDNLWVKLDLEEVGIPWEDVSSKCKLLLTSRSENVLIEMGAYPIVHLHGLTDGEASRLFEKEVGDRLKDNKKLKSIADQVVKKLAGLPLLIISVARTLKSSDESAWRNALIEIDDSNKRKIETIVRLSYDHLNSEDAKYLFVLCGLMGGTIRVELLFVLAIGLGLFKSFNKTIQDSRDRLNNMLSELRSACLLLDGGNDKDNVTIHDLHSEVVISSAFSHRDSLMINNDYDSWPKEKREKCWACLVNVGSDRLVELMLHRFPHMKILVLLEQNDMGDRSRMDFTCMEELRALCLRSMRITSLPSSIEILGNLQSLSINCHVEDVANLGKLKALQILSFAGSTICRLPKEIGKLTKLRSLNLSQCRLLKIIEPGALKGLINLEELHMKKSFDQWMGKLEIPSESCGVGLVELKNLTKLASLEISILRPVILLEDGDLPFENLDKFWINIGYGAELEYGGLKTMMLNLEGHDSILSIKWIKKNLQKTQYLWLSKLSEFKESPHELCTQGFREVEYLRIEDSPSIKYIAHSSNGCPLTAFGKLEYFLLDNLINLEKICDGSVALECFSKLKAVSVKRCDRLKYLWCFSDVQRLVQLEDIAVENCDSMQSIVTYDAGEGIVSTDNRVELPNVRNLLLFGLPNMTSFGTKAEITSEDTPIQVSLPHLKSLTMVGLLGPEKILYSEPSLKYSNLRSLIIKKSKSLSTSILKLDWTLKLPNLESMSLGSSLSAEVVFDMEELKVSRDVEILSQLIELTLRRLPNVQRMWKHDVKLQGISILRNLRRLSVYETGLSFLFSVSVAKCLREIRAIVVSDCPNMKAVIVDEDGRNEGTCDIIEFPLLEHLSIRRCPMEKFFSCPHGKKEPATTTSDSQDANSDSFFDQKVTFPNITSLRIKGLHCKELWNNQILIDSFQKLEYLLLMNCDNLQHIATSYMWKKLQRCLKKLEVISCRSMEIIYEGDAVDTKSGKLRRLVLCDLKNLRCIWQSDSLPNIPFPNLREIEAVECPCLEMLFPTFTVNFLEQIELLVVESCEHMRQIAGHENLEEATSTRIIFFKLTTLRLFRLLKFRSFLPEKYSLKFSCSKDFPSLRVLRIQNCGAEPSQARGIWRRPKKKGKVSRGRPKLKQAFRKHS